MVYKLSFNHAKYLNLNIDMKTLQSVIGGKIGRREFFDYRRDNRPLKPFWEDVGAEFVEVGGEGMHAPDIILWNATALVLSEKAYSALSSHLEPFGEFLPITVEDERYLVFNCLNVVSVDLEKSQADIVDGIWLGVKSIAFARPEIDENLIFKSEFDRCGALYCGGSFKDLVAQSNFKGLLFNEDLTSGL